MTQKNEIRFENKSISVLDESKNYTDKKVTSVNFIMAAIIVVFFLAFTQLIIDSFRFSSVTYKEYSGKIESLESVKMANEKLLEQNYVNQQLIIEQQQQILNLLK